jgi:hypothetical protein
MAQFCPVADICGRFRTVADRFRTCLRDGCPVRGAANAPILLSFPDYRTFRTAQSARRFLETARAGDAGSTGPLKYQCFFDQMGRLCDPWLSKNGVPDAWCRQTGHRAGYGQQTVGAPVLRGSGLEPGVYEFH